MSRILSAFVFSLLVAALAGCNGTSGLQNNNCPAGQTTCGAVCATLGTDDQNCGACGFSCAAGLRCQGGYCKADCVPGYIGCPIGNQIICVNPQTDRSNCGGCGNIFDGGQVCVSGEVCSAGKCGETCSPGYSACQPKDAGMPLDAGQDAGYPYCANLLVDANNCGGCGVVCGPGKACCASNGFAGCVSTFFDPNNCGVCGHSCNGGTCGAGLCTPTQLATGCSLEDIKVGGPNVFFIGSTITGSACNIVQFPSVYSVPIGGGSLSQVAQGSFAPVALAIDSPVNVGSSVYWSDANQDWLYAAPISGAGSIIPIGTTGMDTPVSYGVAASGSIVYWAGIVDAGIGSITARPLNLLSPPVKMLTAGFRPNGIAVDTQHVYWTDLADGGNVYRYPLAGGTIQTLATGQTGAAGIAIDQNYVYWTATAKGTVQAWPLDGGAIVTIASGEVTPTRIAADGTYIFWTDKDTGLVMKAPLDGGNALPVAAAQGGPTAIAVDSNYVYWINTTGDQVMRAPK